MSIDLESVKTFRAMPHLDCATRAAKMLQALEQIEQDIAPYERNVDNMKKLIRETIVFAKRADHREKA